MSQHSSSLTLTRIRCGIFALALAALGMSCGSTGTFVWVQTLPLEPPATRIEDRIGVGDLVNVRVFSQEAMSARARVRPNGTLFMPILGEIKVESRMPAELAKELEGRLQKYIVAPNVSVIIEESVPLKITALGELRRVGVLNLEPPATVLHALAQAGGLTDFAGEDDIYVLRAMPNGSGIQRIRFNYRDISRGEPHSATFRLRSGDVLVAE